MKTAEEYKHHRVRSIYKNLAHDMRLRGFSDKDINKKAHEVFDAEQSPTLKHLYNEMIFKRFGLHKLTALVFPKRNKNER